jgi:hypothetical protein
LGQQESVEMVDVEPGSGGNLDEGLLLGRDSHWASEVIDQCRSPLDQGSGWGRFDGQSRRVQSQDVVTDERGDEWELRGHPTKVVGAQDFFATVRRVDSPAETREARWRARERVRIKRS